MKTQHALMILLGCSFICATICLELYLSAQHKPAGSESSRSEAKGPFRLPQLAGKPALRDIPFYAKEQEELSGNSTNSEIKQTSMIDAEGPVVLLQTTEENQLDKSFQLVSEPPLKLSSPDQASPLVENPEKPEKSPPSISAAEQQFHRQQLLKIIRQELPDASDAEIDVWLKQMEDMTPMMARQMLQLRNKLSPPHQFQTLPNEFQNHPAAPPEPNYYVQEEILTPEMAAAELKEIVRNQPVLIVDDSIQSLMQARNAVLINLANMNTAGYKRIYHTTELKVTQTGGNEPVMQLDGMRLTPLRVDDSQGELEETGREWDLAIEGKGYFQIADGATQRYTRAGRFACNAEFSVGMIVQQKFYQLDPPISVPANTISITVADDGMIYARTSSEEKPTAMGRIQLTRFAANDALLPVKGCLLSPSKSAGKPIAGVPTKQGMGRIHQGFLEGSNVDAERELQHWQKWNQQIQVLMSVLNSEPGENTDLSPPIPRHAKAGPELKLQQ